MRYLLLSSLVLLFASCTSVYSGLQKSHSNADCILRFKPKFERVLYSTTVDVIGKHLSGVLLIKQMPDSSTRMVFTNEVGFKFFDFEFASNGDFKVYYILKQMDKKAVKKTLRRDFELVLMQHLDLSSSSSFYDSSLHLNYFKFPRQKGSFYYITDASCEHLLRMEKSSKRKPFVKAIMQQYSAEVPDTIGISHTNFNFTIGLKRLQQ